MNNILQIWSSSIRKVKLFSIGVPKYNKFINTNNILYEQQLTEILCWLYMHPLEERSTYRDFSVIIYLYWSIDSYLKFSEQYLR